jgi:hypothetical protein
MTSSSTRARDIAVELPKSCALLTGGCHEQSGKIRGRVTEALNGRRATFQRIAHRIAHGAGSRRKLRSRRARRTLVFMSGSVSRSPDGAYIVGKVGSDLTVDDGYAAARGAGIYMLSRIRSVIGSLNNVQRVVKVLGMVNASPDFKEHPKVIDGFRI